MQDTYIVVDGDDVGSRLEYFMLTNQPQSLKAFAVCFEASFEWFVETLVSQLAATIIFSGGDNLLAVVQDEKQLTEELERLRDDFTRRTKHTLSIGLGRNANEAYFALKLAKASGKNRICRFSGVANE